jgi:hypothetical protein
VHIEIPTGWSTKGLEVYVFDEGTFQLVGQGGYNNWSFVGNYKWDGKFVRFYLQHPRSCPMKATKALEPIPAPTTKVLERSPHSGGNKLWCPITCPQQKKI